jgi:hypothetical protein
MFSISCVTGSDPAALKVSASIKLGFWNSGEEGWPDVLGSGSVLSAVVVLIAFDMPVKMFWIVPMTPIPMPPAGTDTVVPLCPVGVQPVQREPEVVPAMPSPVAVLGLHPMGTTGLVTVVGLLAGFEFVAAGGAGFEGGLV